MNSIKLLLSKINAYASFVNTVPDFLFRSLKFFANCLLSVSKFRFLNKLVTVCCLFDPTTSIINIYAFINKCNIMKV